MLGPITWLTGLKRLNVLKADDIVIVLLFIILKMSEANFNENLVVVKVMMTGVVRYYRKGTGCH